MIEQRLASWKSEIDSELDRLLPSEDTAPLALARAMRYCVFAGGKRLRPILALAAADAVGRDAPKVLPAACAIEMIHTYSLVHDDLPAMDDDSLRRGKPAAHVAFGEANAILAGDALLTRAMEILATEPPGDVFAPRRAEVVAVVAHAAGADGMVGGQVDDLDTTGAIDEPRLLSIHRRKTAALITASVMTGAILAGAAGEQRVRLRSYGEAVGLAFQIVDDILDVESTTAQLGKSAGKDVRDAKLTFPALLGLEESRRRAESLVDQARTEVASLGAGARILSEIVSFVVLRKH